MNLRWLGGFSLAMAWSVSAEVVDLSALEYMASYLADSALPENCTAPQLPDGLQLTELPDDFDNCRLEGQTNLLNKGFYASTDGSIKALPYKPAARAASLAVQIPQPITEQVASTAVGPFVIDLVQSNSSTANGQIKPVNIAPIIHTNVITKPVKAPVTTGCTGLQTFAHRGSPHEPENSVQAVLTALAAGNSGVEIDAQQLQDGTWVVHHDLRPGRATSGPGKFVTSMVSHDWEKVYLKTRHGNQTETPAPFLNDVLDAFRQHAAPQQYLNIEIKGGAHPYSCNALTKLDKDIRIRMGSARFLYSARKVENLRCLRAANPKVYLGLVIDPHPDTVDAELAAQTIGQTAIWYAKIRQEQTGLDLYLKNSNREHLKRKNFEDLDSLIGPYFGFHIDYKDYWEFAPVYGHNKNLRLMLYQLNDDSGLLGMLSRARSQQKRLPAAVIIDSDPSFYCDAWNENE